MTNEHVLTRISRQLGVDNLTELLADGLSGADLHSLLLAAMKRRISKVVAPHLLQPSTVTKACDLDARLLNRVERIAYEIADSYDAIELAPLAPLGSVNVLTKLDQSNVLSTIRAFECSSDPTVGLGLECARRRKTVSGRKEINRLCTSHRVVRFPSPPVGSAFSAHFKLFSLVAAGRDQGSFTFELTTLREQIDFYLTFLTRLASEGFAFDDIVVEVSDTRVVSHLCAESNVDRDAIRSLVRARDATTTTKVLEQYAVKWPKSPSNASEELTQFNLPESLKTQLSLLSEEVLDKLRAKHRHVRFQFNMHRLTGLGYYQGPCFHIKMKKSAGDSFALADGGFVDWTQLLLCDRKERLLTSAIGIELMCRLFR